MPGVSRYIEPKRLPAIRLGSPMVIDEQGLLSSICKESFAHFVREFWDIVVPEPLVWNWHLQVLCDALQEAAERVFAGKRKKHDIVINVPPGTSKSTICSIMFPAWVWTRKPTARTISASYSYTLSMDLSRKSRDIIISEKYQQLFKHEHALKHKGKMTSVRLREDQNAKGYFANQYGGDRFTTSVGGTVTGMHGHFLIVDDPLNPQEAISEAELKTANRWMQETLPGRKVDKRVAITIVIMQRLHQNDPTGAMLERKQSADGSKILHICLPAEDNDELTDEESHVKPKSLRKNYKDGLLDPIRLPREVLEEAEVDLGEFGYAGQFLQNPIPLSGGMFKTKKIKVVDSAPIKLLRVVRYWDKAGTHKGGAWSVGFKMGLELRRQTGKPPIKHFYIIGIERGQWDSYERETRIVATAKEDGRSVYIRVEQEPGSGGKESADDTIGRLAGYRADKDKVTGDKTLRAEPFASSVNGGHVSMVKGDWNTTLLNELAFFPDSKYKDQADAGSGAFNFLNKTKRKVGSFFQNRS